MMYGIAVTNDFSFCLKETIYFTTGEKNSYSIAIFLKRLNEQKSHDSG